LCVVDCQGYFRKSNDVEAKWLHQLQTNSKDMYLFNVVDGVLINLLFERTFSILLNVKENKNKPIEILREILREIYKNYNSCNLLIAHISILFYF
jgi:hypothetical protein